MSVTLHTNKGDLKIEVYCESVPKTAEVCPVPYLPLILLALGLLALASTSLVPSSQLTDRPFTELPSPVRLGLLR